MNFCIDIANEYYKLDEEVREEMSGMFRLLFFRKHEFILKQGDVCGGIYFISKGCCRTFLLKEKKDITTAFRVENNIVCSVNSYLTQTPSEEYIQAIEDTECYFLQYKDIRALLEKHPNFNVFVRVVYESLFIDESKMLTIFRTLNASERYEYFMKHTPKILQRVPLGYLASFLGMSRETLSRMRGKKM